MIRGQPGGGEATGLAVDDARTAWWEKIKTEGCGEAKKNKSGRFLEIA
jgi:hypothetical protein